MQFQTAFTKRHQTRCFNTLMQCLSGRELSKCRDLSREVRQSVHARKCTRGQAECERGNVSQQNGRSETRQYEREGRQKMRVEMCARVWAECSRKKLNERTGRVCVRKLILIVYLLQNRKQCSCSEKLHRRTSSPPDHLLKIIDQKMKPIIFAGNMVLLAERRRLLSLRREPLYLQPEHLAAAKCPGHLCLHERGLYS